MYHGIAGSQLAARVAASRHERHNKRHFGSGRVTRPPAISSLIGEIGPICSAAAGMKAGGPAGAIVLLCRSWRQLG